MRWFVEERNPFGKWSPVVYKGRIKPSPKVSCGIDKVWRNDPVPVPEFLIGADIVKVRSCLSPDGEFFGVELDALRDFFNGVDRDRFRSSVNGGRG